jgi:hypothetical protein
VAARVRTALYGGLLFAGGEALRVVLTENATAAVIAPAVIAEWGAGRLGVSWSNPLEPMPSLADNARRLGRGAAIGLLGASVILGVALLAKDVTIVPQAPALADALLGIVTPLFVALRHELLAHGVVLRLLLGTKSRLLQTVVLSLASVAYAWGQGAAAPALPMALALGLVTSTLYVKDRGGFRALGVHATWLYATQVLFRGGLLDVRPAGGRFTGAAGVLGGSWAAGAIMCAVALLGIGLMTFPAMRQKRALP